MGTTDIIEPPVQSEPELNLLVPSSTFDESLWKSLFQNLSDFFFPKKQAPLVLTSKPIPVSDIWGFYDYKKNGAFGSTVVHILIVVLIIVGTIIARRMVKAIEAPTEVMTLIRPDDVPVLPPSKTKVGGGGGGGDRDKLQAVKGKLPKLAMQQIVPPAVIVRIDNRPYRSGSAANQDGKQHADHWRSHVTFALRASIERNRIGFRDWLGRRRWRRCRFRPGRG
jgi:hypothetical protein